MNDHRAEPTPARSLIGQDGINRIQIYQELTM